MKVVSDAFKLRTKKIKQQDSQIIIKENSQNISKSEITYRFDGKLFSTIMKEIVIKTKDKNAKKGQNLNFKYGLYINNAYEYIDLGDYYIKDEPEQNKGSEIIEITAYDKMINFMNEFKQSDLKLTYPCTLLALLQKMCDVCRVELYSTDFFNNDLNVDEDYFTVQQITYRDVLEKIAEATLSTIYIKENKLYLAPISSTPVETLDRSYLTKLIITDKFGPVNALVLGRGDVEDNVEARDDISISQNGRCEIRFDENEFIEYQREYIINNMFQKVKEFKYYAFEGADLGVIWIEPATCIALKDNDTDNYISYYLSANIVINTGIKSTIEAEVLNETETEYKVTTDEEKKYLKVERMAKKNEGEISDLVQQSTEHEEKITQVTQTVDELRSQVSEVADMTTSSDGYGTVSLVGINESEPIRIVIRPTGEDIAYLYPRNNLFPSNDLYLKNRRLRFKNANGYIFDWELPADLLYYDAEHYDELILDYEGQSCVINKKVGYNADGSKYLLTTPKTVSYTYPKIPLEEGDYTVTVLGYTTAYLFIRLMAQNIYTTQFATRAEMKSEISQTKETIDLSVDKKLTNYSTTLQMNSAISLKADSIINSVNKKFESYDTSEEVSSKIEQTADSITSTVSSTFATKVQLNAVKTEIKQTTDSISSTVSKKVGKNEIISSINQSAEAVTINANKLNLNGYITATNLKTAGSTTINGSNITTGTIDASKVTVKNLNASNITSGTITGRSISGGTITGTQITNGNNFKVDANGNMTCNNATFTGGNVDLSDNGLGAYEGKIRIQGKEFINGLYSEGLVIRKIGSSTNSSSPQSIFLNMYDGEPIFHMRGSSIGIADIKKSGMGFAFENDVIFNVSGTNRQAGLYGTTAFYINDGKIVAPQVQITNAGYAMYGKNTGHTYQCHWTGSKMQFLVDGQVVKEL